MNLSSRLRLVLVLVALICSTAQAETYPTKPIRLVVPYPPGGGTDAVARVVTTPMTGSLGQPLVIENRPGASGLVGTDFAGAADPDGYTLLMFADANTIAPALYAHVNHDPVRDFVPVAELATGPLLIFATRSAPFDTMPELITYARSHPGMLSYASPGNGTAQHLAMERLKMEGAINVLHVPYKGGGQAITDVIAGRVPLGILGLSAALQHVRSGAIKPIAITDSSRSPLLPDVPTVSEAGLPGFEAVQWMGIVAPAKTPKAIVDLLHDAFAKALRDPVVAGRIKDLGLKATPERSSEDFAAFIRDDAKRWPAVVKAVGVKLD